MTIEEALDRCEKDLNRANYFSEYDDNEELKSAFRSEASFLTAVKRVLEKQTPKKVVDSFIVTPVYGDDGERVNVLYDDEFKCPCCGWVIARGVDNKSYFEDVNYCYSCGQALDWSEEESND